MVKRTVIKRVFFLVYLPTKYSKLTLSSDYAEGHTIYGPPFGFRLQPPECHSSANGSSHAHEMRFPRTRASYENQIACHGIPHSATGSVSDIRSEPRSLNMTHRDYRRASGSVRLQHVFFGKSAQTS
jgi:hypothetical protein